MIAPTRPAISLQGKHRKALLLSAALILTGLISTLATVQPARAADVETIRRFDTSERVIVLTFDAGADRGYAGQILDLLADEGISASFGMTGVWAEQNPDLIRRMVNEGHHLMNHSYNHPSFPSLTSAQRADQLARTEAAVQAAVPGVTMKPYFRPPFGEYDASVLADLAASGYFYNVMWTVDSLGWNGLTASQIEQRVLDAAVPGGIVLMHVGAQSQDAIALPDIIDELRNRGYSFATVEELAEGGSRYFPQTGYTVEGQFLRYWEGNGGLFQFGYPITEPRMETNPNGDRVLTQWFERARFEHHPDNSPEHQVLLGLLGREVADGREGERPFQPVEAGSDPNCTFYPPTGHRLCFGFRDYWHSHGGLAIFGYPISEEFREHNRDTGQTYTVQYFERARFEWHPENAGTPYVVLLGRLGAQVLAER